MTFLQMQQRVARQARMDLDRPDDLTYIKAWLNDAFQEVCAYHQWWFQQDTYAQALSGTRTYAFPTTNAAAEASVCESIDLRSVRTIGGHLTFWPAADIDLDDADWTSTTDTGSPDVWTFVGKNIVLNKIPSTAFLASYPTLYFRGYKEHATLSDDADLSSIPIAWHIVPVHKALQFAYDEQGDETQSNKEEDTYSRTIEVMVGKCQPIRGSSGPVSAPTLFRMNSRRYRGTNVAR